MLGTYKPDELPLFNKSFKKYTNISDTHFINKELCDLDMIRRSYLNLGRSS